jgi:hypothetical protein
MAEISAAPKNSFFISELERATKIDLPHKPGPVLPADAELGVEQPGLWGGIED